jgi:hypothetical protein
VIGPSRRKAVSDDIARLLRIIAREFGDEIDLGDAEEVEAIASFLERFVDVRRGALDEDFDIHRHEERR